MKLVQPHPQIFLFLGDSPKDLGAPFVRIQEFYESPYKQFRRRYFKLDKFKSWYKRTQNKKGRFTYYADYYGFNVPGNILDEWRVIYAGDESEDEQRLLTLLGPTPADYYVIGSPKDCAATIGHELSHAFWHLFPEYRNAMVYLQEDQDLRGIHRYLRENMYARDMLADETASYAMFDDPLLHAAGVSTKKLRPMKAAMLNVYDYFKSEYVRMPR